MRSACLAFATMLGLAVCGTATETEKKADRSVLYVGKVSSPRGKAYAEFLHKRFRRIETVERKGFDPRRAERFDVVILDWSQRDRPQKPMSPLGPKEAWHKPTVLLGSAGLMLAEAWEIHGAIG
jgi:hypothetical protein